MLTKKDFKVLANIMKEARQEVEGGIPVDALLDEIQRRLAEFCETQNELFDEHQFNMACMEM